MAYCLPADLYLYGLPRGALASSGRLADSANVADSTIALDAHGFATGDAVQVRPAAGGELPAPLTAATTYYAIAVDDWRFQLAATPGGSAITLTSAGSTFVVLAPLSIDAAIAKASRMIDDMLPAHVVPLADPVPDVVRMTAAELAAAWLLAQTGGESSTLTSVYDAARRRMERWSRGAELRGPNAPPSAQLSTGGGATRARAAVSPWRRYGGIA